MVEAARFYLFAQFLGLLTLPLLFPLFKNQFDRGLSGSTTFGAVLLAFFLLVASGLGLNPWSVALLSSLLAAWAAMSGLWFVSKRKELLGWLKKNKKRLLVFELATFAVFCLAVFLVAMSPGVSGTEKFMDYAILNSAFHARSLPPLDLWLSGRRISYYWFGHLMQAGLLRPSMVCVDKGYNLAVAFVLCQVFSLSVGLFTRLGLGLKQAILGGAIVALGGNLVPFYQMSTGDLKVFDDLWLSSRILPGTITEFPFFSLMVGDLHAHYLMLPVFMLFILMAVQRVRQKGQQVLQALFLNLLVLASSLGNPWNIPLLFLVFLLLRLNRACATPFMHVLPAFLAAPFLVGTGGRRLSLSLVESPSPLVPFFFVWGGAFLMLWISSIWTMGKKALRAGLLSALVCLPLFFLRPALGLLVFGILFLLVGFKGQKSDEGLLPVLFATSGLLILAIPELVYLKDGYGHPFERMNTVFKFYYGAWPLVYTGAVALFLRGFSVTTKGLLPMVLAMFCLGSSFCYTCIGAASRICHAEALSLDGLSALSGVHPDDVAAIRWLRNNSRYGQVCVEAVGQSYSWAARISTFTGCQSILGWKGHELLWRNNPSTIGEREEDVAAIYRSRNEKSVRTILKKYDVSWIVLCGLERSIYGSEALSFVKGMLNKEYEHGKCAIYSFMADKQ